MLPNNKIMDTVLTIGWSAAIILMVSVGALAVISMYTTQCTYAHDDGYWLPLCRYIISPVENG